MVVYGLQVEITLLPVVYIIQAMGLVGLEFRVQLSFQCAQM